MWRKPLVYFGFVGEALDLPILRITQASDRPAFPRNTWTSGGEEAGGKAAGNFQTRSSMENGPTG